MKKKHIMNFFTGYLLRYEGDYMTTIDISKLLNHKIFWDGVEKLTVTEEDFGLNGYYFLKKQLNCLKDDVCNRNAIISIENNWDNNMDCFYCNEQRIALPYINGTRKLNIFGFSEIGNIRESLNVIADGSEYTFDIDMQWYGPSSIYTIPYGVVWNCEHAISMENYHHQLSYIHRASIVLPENAEEVVLPFNPTMYVVSIIIE